MDRNQFAQFLALHGQEHVLDFYDRLDQAGKDKLSAQVEAVDYSLIDRVREENKTEPRGHFEPLDAVTLDVIAQNRDSYFSAGAEALREGKIAAVLLAGGQGTRLGCSGPKGVVDIGITKPVYIFQRLFENTLEVVRATGAKLPFYIMTSDKNHEETVAFLKEHDFFGYPKEDVVFFRQDMTPSVDFEGRLLLEGPDQLSLSPNGNGGWFASMLKAGLKEDMDKRGVEWLNVFAVDNVLQRIADPVFVGATLLSGCTSGAKVVRKADPMERVGVLCLEDGRPSIAEYYEMTDEMIHSRRPDGELSYAFGVILNYLFRRDALENIVSKAMPVHIVDKKIPYITADGTAFKPSEPNGYKFELLVLDMVHMMDSCLSFEVKREKEFAPIKNPTGVDSIESARELLKGNGIEL